MAISITGGGNNGYPLVIVFSGYKTITSEFNTFH